MQNVRSILRYRLSWLNVAMIIGPYLGVSRTETIDYKLSRSRPVCRRNSFGRCTWFVCDVQVLLDALQTENQVSPSKRTKSKTTARIIIPVPCSMYVIEYLFKSPVKHQYLPLTSNSLKYFTVHRMRLLNVSRCAMRTHWGTQKENKRVIPAIDRVKPIDEASNFEKYSR